MSTRLGAAATLGPQQRQVVGRVGGRRGFWRFLLARRYTAGLWPAVRPAFPHLPGDDRRLLEEPVARLHLLRNRVAHHEPLIAESVHERYGDLLAVVGAVDPRMRDWVDAHNQVLRTLQRRPAAGEGRAT